MSANPTLSAPVNSPEQQHGYLNEPSFLNGNRGRAMSVGYDPFHVDQNTDYNTYFNKNFLQAPNDTSRPRSTSDPHRRKKKHIQGSPHSVQFNLPSSQAPSEIPRVLPSSPHPRTLGLAAHQPQAMPAPNSNLYSPLISPSQLFQQHFNMLPSSPDVKYPGQHYPPPAQPNAGGPFSNYLPSPALSHREMVQYNNTVRPQGKHTLDQGKRIPDQERNQGGNALSTYLSKTRENVGATDLTNPTRTKPVRIKVKPRSQYKFNPAAFQTPFSKATVMHYLQLVTHQKNDRAPITEYLFLRPFSQAFVSPSGLKISVDYNKEDDLYETVFVDNVDPSLAEDYIGVRSVGVVTDQPAFIAILNYVFLPLSGGRHRRPEETDFQDVTLETFRGWSCLAIMEARTRGILIEK